MKSLRHLYFPMTIPHPQRAEKWKCLQSYHSRNLEPGVGGIRINRVIIPTSSSDVIGKKLFCFSDLHCNSHNRQIPGQLLELIKRLTPDYVVTTGDLIGFGSELDELENTLELFKELTIPKLAIPGNWERGKNWLPENYWRDLFSQYNWNWLCNQSYEDKFFYFYGTDDLGRGYPQMPVQPPLRDKVNILLAHRPDTVIALDFKTKMLDFDLALCGHNHGGQIRLPLFGALKIPSFYGTHFAAGIFKRPGLKTRMLVTTGVGERTLPFRFNCRREVLLIEFVAFQA